MTKDEFTKRYHYYAETDVSVAWEDAQRINSNDPVNGDTIIPVGFPGLGYCLMLQSTVDYLRGEDA